MQLHSKGPKTPSDRVSRLRAEALSVHRHREKITLCPSVVLDFFNDIASYLPNSFYNPSLLSYLCFLMMHYVSGREGKFTGSY
jgi:hypothetical protein